MIKYDELDIEKGFVLDEYDAVEYLKQAAYDNLVQVMNDDADIDGFEDIINELKDMIKEIENNTKYNFWYLYGHPMAFSGICIYPLEKVQQWKH